VGGLFSTGNGMGGEQRTAMKIQSKMAQSAAEIADRIKSGTQVHKSELKFLNSFIAISGGKAGNAGRRKTVRTGK